MYTNITFFEKNTKKNFLKDFGWKNALPLKVDLCITDIYLHAIQLHLINFQISFLKSRKFSNIDWIKNQSRAKKI